MKKSIIVLSFLVLMLLLCSCNKAEEKPTELRVIKSMTSIDGEDESITQYYHDEVTQLSNGVYLVVGRAETADTTSPMAWFFFENGFPLGSRSYHNDQYFDYSDILEFADYRLDSYLATLDNFGYMEDGVIYFTDGRYEEMEVEDGYIRKFIGYSENGCKEYEISLDEYGNFTKGDFYDREGNVLWGYRKTYKNISVE